MLLPTHIALLLALLRTYISGWGLEFRVSVSGFEVWVSCEHGRALLLALLPTRLSVWGLGFRVWVSGFNVWGFGFWAYDSGLVV